MPVATAWWSFLRTCRIRRRLSHNSLHFGAKVTLVGPPTLVPRSFHEIGVEIHHSLDEILPATDVLMLLRIQKERQRDPLIPSLREYARFFGINSRTLAGAKSDALIMHPGPINRGVEMDPAIADGPRSVILEQVTNGVAVRMALLYLIMGGE